MVYNNDALYDAVVAGAGGGAQQGWLILSTPASYTPFATNIDILATAVDLQIPTIAGGASISQINLLQSITHSVLTARYPVATAPSTYIDIAKAISALYTELEKLLTNQPAVASYGVNWLITDWYIDGVIGDDNNSGISAIAPIKTGAELARRLGPYALFPQSVRVHILANGMIDSLIIKGCLLNNATQIEIFGTATLVTNCGTVTSYTGIDHSIPRAPELKCSAITDWTPLTQVRLRLTDGANPNAYTWVAKANPAGIGIDSARTTRWGVISQTSTSALYTLINPAVGTTVVAETLPYIPNIDIRLDGDFSRSTATIIQYPLRSLIIDSISCPSIGVFGRVATVPARALIIGCRIGQIAGDFTYSSTGGATACACLCNYNNAPNPTVLGLQIGAIYACVFGAPLVLVSSQSSSFGSLNQCVFQACALSCTSNPPLLCTDLQFFDMPGATSYALAVTLGGHSIAGLSGNGNSGYGMLILNGTSIRLGGVTNLLGTVTPVRLGSAPTVNLTWAQFLQPNDFAQKGTTPAMVGGTTTVTVPWYNNTTQKVIVCHGTVSGTPGILSVTQINTTQFTITSSSALDTSTVNWLISPLGTNIYITV